MRGGFRANAGRPKGAKDVTKRMIAPGQAAEMEEQVSFRCTPQQRRRLEDVARRRGVDVSELLRNLIDQL